MKLDIVQLGEPIPTKFIEAAEEAKRKINGLEVEYFAGPNGFKYMVPSPIVDYKSDKTERRSYGESGMILIRKISSGEIK